MSATMAASASLRSSRAPLATARSTNSWVAGKLLDGRRGEPGIVRRTGERIQPVDVLAVDLQRLAAGRQDVDLGAAAKMLRGERRHRFDEMLAGVEDQQNPLVAQIGDQARASHRRTGPTAPAWRPTAVATSSGSLSMPRSTNSTAPRRPRSGDARPRPRPWSCRRRPSPTMVTKRAAVSWADSLSNVVVATDHAAQAGGKVGVRKAGGGRGARVARDRSTARPAPRSNSRARRAS